VADRVVFLRPDAERIARAVRAFENGDRNETPLRFGRVIESQKVVFRVGSFSGAWNLDGAKTVTIRNTTATLVAINLFAAIETVTSNVTRNCAVAKDRGVWYLIAAEC
jgi:hypothetical protein